MKISHQETTDRSVRVFSFLCLCAFPGDDDATAEATEATDEDTGYRVVGFAEVRRYVVRLVLRFD